MTFQIERYLDVRSEAEPLIREHWQEFGMQPTAPDLDHVGYASAEERGQILIITARDNGRLVGYFVALIAPHGVLDYRGTPWAESGPFYLDEEHRAKHIGGLMEFAERVIRERGVAIASIRVKIGFPSLGRLLERLGYEPGTVVYSKRLSVIDA